MLHEILARENGKARGAGCLVCYERWLTAEKIHGSTNLVYETVLLENNEARRAVCLGFCERNG